MFKTYDLSADKFSKKIGFKERPFEAWATDIKNARNEQDAFWGKFGAGFKAAFTNPKTPVVALDLEGFTAKMSEFNEQTKNGTELVAEYFNKYEDIGGFKNFIDSTEVADRNQANYAKSVEVTNMALKKTSLSSKAAAVGMKALSVAMNIGIALLASAAINLIIGGITKLVNAQKDAIAAGEELRTEYTKTSDTIAKNVKSLKSLDDEFATLSKGVDDYGKNVSLTNEEYTRYKEIVSQILTISPQLAEGYSVENGLIANKNELLEKAIALQEKEAQNELQKRTNLDKLTVSMKGYLNEYNKALRSSNGLVGDEGQVFGGIEHTNLSNALSRSFNINGDSNFDTKQMAEQILKSLGIKDVEKTISSYLNEYDDSLIWNDFFQDYATQISQNASKIIADLDASGVGYKAVGIDETTFDINLGKLQSAAAIYKDIISTSNNTKAMIQDELRLIAQASDSSSKLTNDQTVFVDNWLKSFSLEDFTSKNWFGINSIDENKLALIKSQITDFVDNIASDTTLQDHISKLFSLDKSKMPYDEWKSTSEELITLIANSLGLEGEKRNNFIINLGIKTDSLDTSIKVIDDEMTKVSAKDLGALKEDEITIAYKLENKGEMTFNELRQAIKDEQNAVANAKPTIEFDSFTSLRTKYENGTIKSDEYVEALKKQLVTIGELASANPNLASSYKIVSNSIQGAISTASSALDGLRKSTDTALSSAKTLSSAFKEQSENGRLSSESILSIVDAGYAAALSTNAETGAVTLNANAYRLLLESKLSTQIADLEATKINLVSKLTSEQGAAKELAITNYSLAQSYYEKAKASGADIEQVDAQIKALDELKSNIGKIQGGTYGTNSGNGGDKWKEAFDAKKAELQWRREAELITEKDYLTKMATLTDQYFMGKSKYEKEWYQNKKEIEKGWTNFQKAEFEKAYSFLQYQRDKGIIVEKDYLEKLETLNNQYHKNSLEDWQKYDLEIINGKQKLWESEQKAQGDAYIKSIDNRIKRLNEEKQAEQDYYDAKIKNLNEQKQALQDQYTEEDKLLNLELKKQALEKANSQKTAFIYRNGKFDYEADSETVDSARQDLSDSQRDFDRYQIEKNIDDQIKKYEDAKEASIDSIDGQIEQWELLKESVQDQMEQIGETVDVHTEQIRLMAEAESMSFDEMTSSVENYVDTFISKMEELRAYQELMRSQAKSNKQSSGSSSSVKTYATGRLGGIAEDAIVDEFGQKEIIARTLGGRVTRLEYGDSVFPAALSGNFAQMLNSYTPDMSMFNFTPKMTMPNIQSREATPIHISFGDLNLPNVVDADSFAKTINHKLMNAVTQEVFKRR